MLATLISYDHQIFYFFYDLSGRAWWSDFLIVFLGEYLIYLVILFVFWHGYRLWRKHSIKGFVPYIEALVSVAIGNGIIVPLIRLIHERARPFVAFSLSHNVIFDSAQSFPSGHTMFMFTLATSVFFYDRKFGMVLYVCGLLIGLGRIAGGVHYPSDIIASIVLGITTSSIVYILSKKIFKKRPEFGV